MAQLHSSAIYCITRERPPICTACMLCSFWVSVYTAENQQIKVMWTYKFIKTKVCATISSIQTCIPTCTKGVGRHQYILRLCNHDYYNYSKVRSLCSFTVWRRAHVAAVLWWDRNGSLLLSMQTQDEIGLRILRSQIWEFLCSKICQLCFKHVPNYSSVMLI